MNSPGPIINRRIAVLGGKPLTARCLSHLHSWHRTGQVEIVAVLPRPKGHQGWWSKPGVAEVWEVAERLGLHIITSEEDLVRVNIDLGLSVLHYRLVPENVLRHAGNGFLNLHCAPLPHYRGCNACSHAILNGETRFGATLHVMDAKVDHGDVVAVEWFDMPQEITAYELMNLVEEAAFRLFVRLLPSILANELSAVPQTRIIEREGVLSRYYARSSLSDPALKVVDLNWPAEKIHRHVRALDFPPFEPANAMIDGRKVDLTMNNFNQVLSQTRRLPCVRA